MKKNFVMWGVRLLLLVVALSGCNNSELPSPLPIRPQVGASPSPVPLSQTNGVRQVGDNFLPLREYWRISYEYITGSDDTPGLLAMAGYVICHTTGRGVYGQLRILEAQNGVLVWEEIQAADGAETL